MFIVISNLYNERHSAWKTHKDASKQVKVLHDKGYKGYRIIRDDTVETENGHYYV